MLIPRKRIGQVWKNVSLRSSHCSNGSNGKPEFPLHQNGIAKINYATHLPNGIQCSQYKEWVMFMCAHVEKSLRHGAEWREQGAEYYCKIIWRNAKKIYQKVMSIIHGVPVLQWNMKKILKWLRWFHFNLHIFIHKMGFALRFHARIWWFLFTFRLLPWCLGLLSLFFFLFLLISSSLLHVFFKVYFDFELCVCASVCGCAGVQVHRHWTPRSWSCKWLWAIQCGCWERNPHALW